MINREDEELYTMLENQLNEEEEGQQAGISGSSAFDMFIGLILHIVFKALTLLFFLLKNMFAGMFSVTVALQLILIFGVCDFWFTKNVSGKKLISLRWYFESDQYGVSRFMIQCKVNQQRQNKGSKLFWIIQLIYIILPLLLGILSVIQAPFVFIDFQRVFISIGILAGAVTNFFYFMQANKGKNMLIVGRQKAQYDLKRKLGVDLIRRLKNASVVTYI